MIWVASDAVNIDIIYSSFPQIQKPATGGGFMFGTISSTTEVHIISSHFDKCSGDFGVIASFTCIGGSLIFEDCLFTNCTSTAQEGLIFVTLLRSTSLTFHQTRFVDGTSTAADCYIYVEPDGLTYLRDVVVSATVTDKTPSNSFKSNQIVTTLALPTQVVQVLCPAGTSLSSKMNPASDSLFLLAAGTFTEPTLTHSTTNRFVCLLGVGPSTIITTSASTLFSATQGIFQVVNFKVTGGSSLSIVGNVGSAGMLVLSHIVNSLSSFPKSPFNIAGNLFISGFDVKDIATDTSLLSISSTPSVSGRFGSTLVSCRFENITLTSSSTNASLITITPGSSSTPSNFAFNLKGCSFIDCSVSSQTFGSIVYIHSTVGSFFIFSTIFIRCQGTFGSCAIIDIPSADDVSATVSHCIFHNTTAVGAEVEDERIRFIVNETKTLVQMDPFPEPVEEESDEEEPEDKKESTNTNEMDTLLSPLRLNEEVEVPVNPLENSTFAASLCFLSEHTSRSITNVVITHSKFLNGTAEFAEALFMNNTNALIDTTIFLSRTGRRNSIFLANSTVLIRRSNITGHSGPDEVFVPPPPEDEDDDNANEDEDEQEFEAGYAFFSLVYSHQSILKILLSTLDRSCIGSIATFQGSLTINTATFFNNRLNFQKFPNMRSNVFCRDHTTAVVKNVLFEDEILEGDQYHPLWISDASCSLTHVEAPYTFTRPVTPLPFLDDVSVEPASYVGETPKLLLTGRHFFPFNLTCKTEPRSNNKTFVITKAFADHENKSYCLVPQSIITAASGQIRVSVSNDGETFSNTVSADTTPFDLVMILGRFMPIFNYVFIGVVTVLSIVGLIMLIIRSRKLTAIIKERELNDASARMEDEEKLNVAWEQAFEEEMEDVPEEAPEEAPEDAPILTNES
ncbi:hypothetical protein BLNAU_784 [Blattamonas nauphoetae]|uniref:Uncharacterized protein n=1 Tax=Blattamonas nauphoetae TaxID=2049346 RepID=A0ABQ9YKI2_9EUKA|nr:hypothetical protein BLNAU_784 [Blattamonas nauphoetae]